MNANMAKWLAAILVGFPSAAQAETVYRCVVEGGKHDIRTVDGEWYERRPAETSEWTAIGCGTEGMRGGSAVSVRCSFDGDHWFAATGTKGCCGVSVLGQRLEIGALRYTFLRDPQVKPGEEPDAKEDMAGDCALLESGDARPIDAWPLSKKIANGMPFIIATVKDGLKLRPGEWEYPTRHSYFLHLEGKYYPSSGTWSVSAVGFDPHRTNSYHSCAPVPRGEIGPWCGGIHQSGYVMDRRYEPRDGELAAFGYAYTFDEAGTVFFEGKPVAAIMVPNL